MLLLGAGTACKEGEQTDGNDACKIIFFHEPGLWNCFDRKTYF